MERLAQALDAEAAAAWDAKVAQDAQEAAERKAAADRRPECDCETFASWLVGDSELAEIVRSSTMALVWSELSALLTYNAEEVEDEVEAAASPPKKSLSIRPSVSSTELCNAVFTSSREGRLLRFGSWALIDEVSEEKNDITLLSRCLCARQEKSTLRGNALYVSAVALWSLLWLWSVEKGLRESIVGRMRM